MHSHDSIPAHDPRFLPLYTAAEVARLARVKPSSLAYWLKPAGQGLPPLLQPAEKLGGHSPYSFMNLVEAYVLGFLRLDHGLSMPKIRKAVKWLQTHYPNHRWPLATLALETDGLELFIRDNQLLVSASKNGQVVMSEIMDKYMSRIERGEDGLPKSFFPYMADVDGPRLVAIDPAIQFGRPVIAGTRISASILAERFSAGESMSLLAKDYDLELEAVEEALRCSHLFDKSA